MSSSFEWIEALAAANARLESRSVLKLAQAVSTMFDASQWSSMQQRLLNDING